MCKIPRGNTPLHIAIISEAPLAKLVLFAGSGANLDIPNGRGKTPMNLYLEKRSLYADDLKEIAIKKH